jgi:hypothetical protein
MSIYSYILTRSYSHIAYGSLTRISNLCKMKRRFRGIHRTLIYTFCIMSIRTQQPIIRGTSIVVKYDEPSSIDEHLHVAIVGHSHETTMALPREETPPFSIYVNGTGVKQTTFKSSSAFVQLTVLQINFTAVKTSQLGLHK